MLKDLTYNVVIIDDDVDIYEDYVEFIKNKLENEGYLLNHTRFEELESLDEYSLIDVDLFLVDLKFGKEDKGPIFIEKIRENYLTDILFYSSDSKKIEEKRNSGKYEGVFFASRDENSDEIQLLISQLINKMLKRSNTPLSSRGIVLGCVAELDNIVKEKIAKLLLKIEPEQRKELMDSCIKIYYDSYKSQSKDHEHFWGCDFHNGMKKWHEVKENYRDYDISELTNTAQVTDSYKNCIVLLKIYESIKGRDETYAIISKLLDLLGERNIFAHVQEELNSDGLYQFKRLKENEYLILTKEKCREMRSNIVKYYKCIDSINNE